MEKEQKTYFQKAMENLEAELLSIKKRRETNAERIRYLQEANKKLILSIKKIEALLLEIDEVSFQDGSNNLSEHSSIKLTSITPEKKSKRTYVRSGKFTKEKLKEKKLHETNDAICGL